jgi:ribosomal protein S27AE
MVRLQEKICARCSEVLERIYNRQKIGKKTAYVPIGYRCPNCAEAMTIYDMGYQQVVGNIGLACPLCEGKLLVLTDGERLRCIKCKTTYKINRLD